MPNSPLIIGSEADIREAARKIGEDATNRAWIEVYKLNYTTGQLMALPGRVGQVTEAKALHAAGVTTDDELRRVLDDESWKQGVGPGVSICE
jgi:hypothetical protein